MLTRKKILIIATAIILIEVMLIKGEIQKQTPLNKILSKEFSVEVFIEKPKPERIEFIRSGRFMPYKLTYKEMNLTYAGTYFITSYCPYECGGSWNTASGETCHRADYGNRLSEPTTCAIDRQYHSFGEEFYIPEFDRTFVAEDTGSGVKGYHLDLFYEDYEDVLSFPTGYYDVYYVEWEEVTVIVWEDDNEYLKIMSPIEYYR